MTDLAWPSDLVPFASGFYLQPHTGGSESPFSRQTKVYGLSAPRWVCSMSFRAERNPARGSGKHVIGARLDALLAKLGGRQNRIAIYDFDRASPTGALASASGNLAALQGSNQMTITGMSPGTTVAAGGYIGGDGRPHIILDPVIVDGSGHALVTFAPHLVTDVAASAAIFSNVAAYFRIQSDDAGQNFNQVGQLSEYSLEFAEDLGPAVAAVTYGAETVTY